MSVSHPPRRSPASRSIPTTAALFGRRGLDRFNLYITNGAFPFFSTTHQPSLMRLHLRVPGAPR